MCGLELQKPAALRHLELTDTLPPLSDSVAKLHQACGGSSHSPYTFVRILATQIGSGDEAPRFALLQLRLAVLLSLATHGPRLPLLVLGADLVFAHRLLRSALELCPLPSVFSQLIPPSAALYRDQNGVHHLQAGQLQRAEGGVLYLGQLAALKSSVRQQVINYIV